MATEREIKEGARGICCGLGCEMPDACVAHTFESKARACIDAVERIAGAGSRG